MTDSGRLGPIQHRPRPLKYNFLVNLIQIWALLCRKFHLSLRPILKNSIEEVLAGQYLSPLKIAVIFYRIFYTIVLFNSNRSRSQNTHSIEMLWVDYFLICHRFKQNFKNYQNPIWKIKNKNLQIDLLATCIVWYSCDYSRQVCVL